MDKSKAKPKVRDRYQEFSLMPDILEPSASLPRVIEAMARTKSSRAVFIVDEKGRFCGIVTARELIRAFAESGSSDFEIPRSVEILGNRAEHFMVPAESVGLDDTIEEALRKAARSGLEDLPVVEEGRIVGVLDCFEMLLHAME
ncbi:MAG: CBS domain-containing protein [bacterium]